MNPSAPVTSTVRPENTSAKSVVRPASSSAVHTPFVASLTGDTITRLVRRLVAILGRLAPPTLRRQLERTRVGRKLTRVVEAGSIYEPDVRSALGAIVRPGWICVDVGAHRGVITLQLAHLVGPSG